MKVTIPSFREGEVTNKQDILDTRDVWEAVDSEIDEKNIREEGLDRRVFDPNTSWMDTGTQAFVADRHLELINASPNWEPMKFSGSIVGSGTIIPDPVSGGIDTKVPTIEFDWDPSVHSYAIIRASFHFWCASMDKSHAGEMIQPKFGIYMITPKQMNEGTIPAMETREATRATGSVVTQKGLDLSAEYGSFARSSSSITADAGHVAEYGHDRRANMTDTITMIFVVNSGRQSGSGLVTPGSGHGFHTIGWDRAGRARFMMVHKYKYTPGALYAQMGNLNLSAQIFRR